ncbi:hypothetical protein JOD45_003135 [Scopulibacillus daqui]|uniref:Uncharacterized protein n=1 Tax=Scopulibacillus daqui TaxID=1469162 RepID=A0ABS2Q3X2_9BACL|nr:hypothetical protein [Scopulibacillus daqui]MBM7646901.1 hypothetical protein [Scopulibacillus daqui]
MIGALFLEKEIIEIEYLVKRELEELLFDLNDKNINHIVKRAMEERYQILFKILCRFASHQDCMKYMRSYKKNKKAIDENNT